MNDPADPISTHAAASEQDLRARFVRTHLAGAFGLICALTSDVDEAQELTQEAMIKILQRHSGPHDLDNAAERLRDAAISLAMNYLHQVADPPKSGLRSGTFRTRQIPGSAPSLLDVLSVPERVAFLLRDVEGFSAAQVARYMGCSQAELRTFLAKARLTVQELSASESGK